MAGDGGERGAQLMGDGEQEFPLTPLTTGQRCGQGIERVGDLRDLGRTLGLHGDVPAATGQRPGCGGRVLQRAGKPASQ